MSKHRSRPLTVAILLTACLTATAHPLSARGFGTVSLTNQLASWQTTRVSVAPGGIQGNGRSGAWLAMSGNGRYVAYFTYATNISPFPSSVIHDRVTGQNRGVFTGFDGLPLTSGIRVRSLSNDGRYALFESHAANILPGTYNSWTQVYLLDQQSGQITHVSTDSGGKPRTGGSGGKLSGDGRYVVYGTNYYWSPSLILRDLTTSHETVIVPSDTNPLRHKFFEFAISDDGRFIVFEGVADLLSDNRPVNSKNDRDIYIYDRVTGTTERITKTFDGKAPDDFLWGFSISGDGNFVIYGSRATNLVGCGQTCPSDTLYAYNTASGHQQPILFNIDLAIARGVNLLSVSRDGRFVAFIDGTGRLVPGDNNRCYAYSNCPDAVVLDRLTNRFERASISSTGEEANGLTNNVLISADGSVVAFVSEASNLVTGDTNGVADVFVRFDGNMPSPLPCASLLGVDIPFPALFRLRLITDSALYIKRWTYENKLRGAICPNATYVFGFEGDPTDLTSQTSPIITIQSPSGLTTKVSPKGDIETQLPVQRGLPKPGVGVAIDPPTLSASLTGDWGVQNEEIKLSNEQKQELSFSIKPPRVSPRYLIAVSQAATKIVVVFGVFMAAKIAPAINTLIFHYQGPSPIPIPGLNSSSSIGISLQPTSAGVRPPQTVISALANRYGQELIDVSEIHTLSVDGSTKHPSEVVTVQGSGFTPGGLIHLSLSSTTDPDQAVEVETRSDSNGLMSTSVTIPVDARPGAWLVSAFDISALYKSLQLFSEGRAEQVNGFILANEIQVRHRINIPVVNR